MTNILIHVRKNYKRQFTTLNIRGRKYCENIQQDEGFSAVENPLSVVPGIPTELNIL